jgi:hypothetical protein
LADSVTKLPVQWAARVEETSLFVLLHFEAVAESPILLKNF